jgi:hypothetical protein
MRDWYVKNAERHRETARQSRLRRLEKVRAYDRARGYRDAGMTKRRARRALFEAIQRGELERGECAFSSEGNCDGRIEGHHRDYSKPLEVQWVCRRHHGRLHQTFNF